MLPETLVSHVRETSKVRTLYESDRAAGKPGVSLPFTRRRSIRMHDGLALAMAVPARTFCKTRTPEVLPVSSAAPEHPARVRCAFSCRIEKPASCHTFRHCFATHRLRRLRHPHSAGAARASDVKTTMIYTHVLNKGGAASEVRSISLKMSENAYAIPPLGRRSA